MQHFIAGLHEVELDVDLAELLVELRHLLRLLCDSHCSSGRSYHAVVFYVNKYCHGIPVLDPQDAEPVHARTMLVVDDEVQIRRAIRNALRDTADRILEAETGA